MHNIAKDNDTRIIIAELQEKTFNRLEKNGTLEIFGAENIVENVEDAMVDFTLAKK